MFSTLAIRDAMDVPGLRVLCVREVQKTLAQSSKHLIESRLADLGLGEADGFKVFKEAIQTPGDGLISFVGMQEYNADNVKSLEDYNRAWLEEAQQISQRSLDLLRPTIRVPGSEIWAGWNPRRKVDPIDVLFRGAEVPTGSIVIRANWQDNPWFPPELEQERLDCLRLQPDQYAHIWEGDYVTVASGAYYARDLADARLQGRITSVRFDPLMRVRLYWDIGGTGAKADACAIWPVQFVGDDIRTRDYYEAVGQPLAAHIRWLTDHGYGPGKAECVLPHDGSSHDKVYNVSFESALREAGYAVEVIPNQGAGAAMQRVERARRLFGRVLFDAETTEAGRAALGWYHPRIDEKRNLDLGPEHDWASNGADAFGLMCVGYREPKPSVDYAAGYEF